MLEASAAGSARTTAACRHKVCTIPWLTTLCAGFHCLTLQNKLNFSVAEDSNWVPDWHKAVRRLGGYGSMAARLQAVRLVHPR